MKKALIYCRVSSERQVREGNGLEGQEKRCRDYVKSQGYVVDKVFRDAGISGGILNRPGIKKLFDYVASTKGKYVVVIDDISRLARDTVIYKILRKAIEDVGCEFECTNVRIDNTPEGQFSETILAAGAELERHRNTRQVNSRMRARLELGYWVFDAPPGYKYAHHAGHGKILIFDEPKATLVKEAVEGFATGRFATQQDVQEFLTAKKFVHRGKFKIVHLEQVKRILTRSLYAGIIDYLPWGIKSQGKHQAIITVETYLKVQEKLFGRAKQVFVRKSDHEDFPIRGFALCPGCNKPYTGSWSKGRSNKYPYYRCNSKKCINTQKSIKKEVLEGLFSQILQTVTPGKQIVDLAKAITLDVFNQKRQQIDLSLVQSHKEIKKIDKQIDEATNKLIESRSVAVQAALERKIEELERQHRRVQQSTDNLNSHHHQIDFGTALDAVMKFIANPHDAWVSGDLKQEKLVQRLVFTRPIALHPSQPIGTADLSLPFKLLKGVSGGKNELVGGVNHI